MLPATDPPEFTELAREIEQLAGAQTLALATRADGEIGVSAQTGTGLGFTAAALAHESVRSAFEKVWLGGQRLAAHDVKNVVRLLHDRGFAPRVFADDTMIGAHLLNPSRTFGQLEEAAAEFLGVSVGEDVAAHADAVLALAKKEREELACARATRVVRKRRSAARAGSGEDGVDRRAHRSERARRSRKGDRHRRGTLAASDL